MTRKGKIARLPLAVREELNRRLHDGESGQKLLHWLNTVPEVQAILASDFGGLPLRKQNLSQWRQGGYQEWLHETKATEILRQRGTAPASGNTDPVPTAETIAEWIAARYKVLVETQSRAATPTEEFRLLRRLYLDLTVLRRGTQRALRLRLDRERAERRARRRASQLPERRQ